MDGYEVTRLHAVAEEEATLKSRTEIERTPCRKMAFRRALSAKLADSGLGPMVARKTSDRNTPLGGHVAVKQSEAAIAALIAAKGP